MRAIWTRLAPGIAALALALASGAANADCDVMTGGGFIMNNGAQANFGVAGGCKDGMPTFGHLEYIDHGVSLNVHWTSITAYQFDSNGPDFKGHRTGSRFICGTARTNPPQPSDEDVDFAVRANDTGEPGTTDEFDIQLTKRGAIVYTTNVNFLGLPHQLNGGNIQLHGPTTGTFSPDSCPARFGFIA